MSITGYKNGWVTINLYLFHKVVSHQITKCNTKTKYHHSLINSAQALQQLSTNNFIVQHSQNYSAPKKLTTGAETCGHVLEPNWIWAHTKACGLAWQLCSIALESSPLITKPSNKNNKKLCHDM